MTAERHDGLNWFAFGSIEKFSPDQAAWANRRIAATAPWRMRRDMARNGSRYHTLLADTMRLTGAPEDGLREHAGNLLVTVGLNQITLLITGQGGAALGTSGTHNNTAVCGVGSSATAAVVGDTHLGGDGSSSTAWYQQCDATYPTQSNGVITMQATFATGNANFAWNEWCWVTGTGAITAGATLNSGGGGNLFATTAFMVNHKVPASSLGTKASGASWVFTTTITLS